MNAYLLIGEPGTRKSSLLRSLTGCFNRNERDIQLLDGRTIRIYARVSTLQESKTTPKDFLVEVQKRNCPNVIFSLLPDPNPLFPIPFPDAQTYIDTFLAAGWDFVSTAVVGIHPISPAIPNVAHFPRAASLPINIVARNIRAHFDWH
ncbi:MAG: hypothetical protein F9K32_09510 [Desulfobulbaceae bacterium]|nr:MAG: hypothetical protein F9K32_09510 [Desulfobulbaceae bacterium]